MKTKLFLLLAIFFSISQACVSQKTVTVTVDNDDISKNLDLYAIAYTFGEAADLADFEKKLNDYDAQISNLDLNNDGEVDYLRVVEAADKNVHLIVIQAVLAEDIFQDVATLTVEKEQAAKTATVQIVGDPYIYGTNYVIEPVYITTPVIYSYFWGPTYHRYYSPYYWGYYPNYFRYRRHVHINVYHHHMYDFHRLHHSHCQYHYADRPSHNYHELHGTVSKNDYGRRYPEKAFNTRNAGATNTRDLDQRNSRNTNSMARTPNTRSSAATSKNTDSRRSAAKPATTQSNSRTASRNNSKATNSTTNSRNSSSNVQRSSSNSSAKQPARSSSSSSVSRSSKPANSSSATRSSSSNTSGKSSVSSSSRSNSGSRSSSSSSSRSSSSRSSSSNNNSRR